MTVIVIISLTIYTIAAIAIYYNLYNFDKTKKIKFIILGCIIILLITTIIVLISSINIEEKEYLGITKTTSILLFAPINSIIVLPYIGHLLNKYKDKKITEEQLKKKFLIALVLLIIIVIFELGYIKDFQTGLIQNAIR